MNDWRIKGKPTLLIMHMQKGMVGKESQFPGAAEVVQKSGIIPHQQDLLRAFRSKQLPVIFINDQNNPPLGGKLRALGVLSKPHPGESKPRDLPAESDPRELEVIPELTPLVGEPVLINWPFGAFNNSGLDQALRICGAETLVLTGFATNGVVLNAIIMASDRYYSVIVPRDASTSLSDKAHEAVMEILAPEMAVVTTTEDVIAHL